MVYEIHVKGGNCMNELSGTKELIFDVFIALTSAFGYENVSMRDIAKKLIYRPARYTTILKRKGRYWNTHMSTM